MYEEVVSMVDGGIMVYKELSGVEAHNSICIRLLVSTLIWGLGSGIWDLGHELDITGRKSFISNTRPLWNCNKACSK